MSTHFLDGIDYGRLEFQCRKDQIKAEIDFVKGKLNHLFCSGCGARVGVDRMRTMVGIELEYLRDKKLQDGVLGALVAGGSQAINKSMDELRRDEWEFILLENDYVRDFIDAWINF